MSAVSPMVDLHPRCRVSSWRPFPAYPISRSKPFIESVSGMYTHRPRSATLYETARGSHIAIRCWCGMVLCVSSGRRKGCFLDAPSNRPVCATCEGRAIGAGQLGSREIAGRAVMYSPRGGK